jgi:hypothetical protein
MPELNHNFIKGRMNKDLDERLVANGEYRDALNIEVSTSEGANVGTVQTTMGNTMVGAGFGNCVASIVDEKNDDIYWLTAGGDEEGKDAVLKYHKDVVSNSYIVTPVLVDIWKITYSLAGQDGHVTVDDGTDHLHVSNLGNSIENITSIREGMLVTGTFINNTGSTCNVMGSSIANGGTYTLDVNDNVIVDKIENDISSNPGWRIYLKTIIGNTTYTLFPSKIGDSITFRSKEEDRVLQFDGSRLITGINILDDLMFWTDNYSEPKKINLTRSIEGTLDINTHTLFTVKDIDNQWIYFPFNSSTPGQTISIKKQHITVVKKSPFIAPKLQMDDTEVSRGIITTSISTLFSDGVENLPVHSLASPSIKVFNTNDMSSLPDWVVGDIILATNNANGVTLFENWEVRLRLVDISPAVTGNDYTFEIIGITANELPFNPEPWEFVLERSEPLFEFKFPRFGYRYKYQDGEYSSFSPFSRVAFLPGPFDYNPKKGYNLGMKNQLRNLKVKDFIEEDSIRPNGVVSVDILYKESNSPNIYTVKTINTNDSEWSADGTNANSGGTGLTRGSIDITSEVIYATVPSNQLLRPWDNVPRKALAQDISANRLIYGNYLQNFNLKDIGDKTIKINSTVKLESSKATPNDPKPSVKSLRTYQLGLVYRDEFGRETPVLASKAGSTGSISVKKEAANKENKLKIELSHDPPTFANSFKFFVKETSNEYYNLAMDRWYPAEDGNIWISFPSSERNKVDEETYLILKKQHDGDGFVSEDAKYKIIAISNEVPEFVKKKKKIYGSLGNNSDRDIFGHSGGGYPDSPDPNNLNTGVNFIYVNKEAVSGSSLQTFKDGDHTRYLRFKTLTRQSHWYEIANILEIELNNAGEADTYKIEVTESFKEDMHFTTENANGTGTAAWADRIGSGNSTNPGSSDETLSLQIAKEEDEVKPEHRGRFFVKIFQDGILQENVMVNTSEAPTFVSVYSEPIYHLDWDSWWAPGNYDTQVPDGSDGGRGFSWSSIFGAILTFASPMEELEKRSRYWWRMFGSHWFIDNAQTRTNDYSTYWGSVTDADDDGPGNGITAGGITNNNKTIQLAFSGVYNAGAPVTLGGNKHVENHAKKEDANLDIGVNANLEEKTWVDHITSVGTVFKWSKDPDGTIYVVEQAKLYKSKSRHNDSHHAGIEDELNNYDAKNRAGGKNWRNSANFRVRWEITVGQWSGSGQKPTTTNPGDGIGVNTSNQYDPRNSGSWGSGANHHDNAHAIEILELEEDLEGDFSSTNPAIFETEPKEDIGLDLYYEASDANPINLDYKTNEIYIPVTSYLTLPGDRTWATSNNTYVPGSTLKVTAFNDDTITVNDQPLSLNPTTNTASPNFGLYTEELNVGDSIIFNKPSGGMVTGKVVLYTPVAGSTSSTIKLDKSLHNRTYYLDWFNCFSFGNGVESNRIRDDFNAVTIDKGPKVSTTLATPYEEERKTNGLIYSGIYNSTSGINNLNQFIMAEKITKDLSPRFGSIQKLHARDTDLVTLCEDKVVRLLANKDAVYNADGKAQLIATDRVLGQTVPYAGEFGISKNPESFASQSFQSYFSDKTRGVVMRLSRDGLMPISEHGMKDWFSDNLKDAGTIIGSYDDKKSLYNITLKNRIEPTVTVVTSIDDSSYANTNGLGYWSYTSNAITTISGTGKYGQFDINDSNTTGGGSMGLITQIVIPPTDFYNQNRSSDFLQLIDVFSDCPDGTVYLHYQVQAGSPGEELPSTYTNTGAPIATYKINSITTTSTGAYNINVVYDSGAYAQIDMSYFWWTSEGCDVVSGSSNDSSKDITETTLSFAEKTNGWVSFKSWIQESGLSINSKFYTFSNGNLYEHESNLVRNNYYGDQYTSTIDVLLNESPQAVKSFQTLKYSGSKARITQNLLTGINSDGNNQFDNEYYNNIGSTGWYVSSIETDLQSGKELEFKSKEGKWFTTMQGMATYFNNATDTNMDEKEFSVQGIGYSSSILCPECGDDARPTTTTLACDDRIITGITNGSHVDLLDWFNQDAIHRAYTFADYTFEVPQPASPYVYSCYTGTANNRWDYLSNVKITIPANSNGHPAGLHTFYNYADVLTFTDPIIGASITGWHDIAAALDNIYGLSSYISTQANPCICDSTINTSASSHVLTVKDNPVDH